MGGENKNVERSCRIALLVGDIGSANELIPVAGELEKRGHNVRWFLDPDPKAKAGAALDKAGIKPEAGGDFIVDGFDLVLIGASVTAYKAQLVWTRQAQEHGVPVVWLEDMWATAARPAQREIDPDGMLVIDEMAADITRKTRPNLKQVRIVGKPTFADLVPMAEKREEIRTSVRHDLGVSDDEFLFVHWSSGSHPESDVRIQIDALRARKTIGGRPAVFAPRLHPKLGTPETQQSLWELATSGAVKTVDARKVKAEHLSIASDAVVSAWNGTEGYRALLLGCAVVTPLFPDDRKMRLDAGFPEGLTPIVKSDEQGAAHDLDELIVLLDEIAKSPREVLRAAVAKRSAPFQILMQSGASTRIADAALSFIRE